MDVQRIIVLLVLWCLQKIQATHSFLGLLKEADYDNDLNSFGTRDNSRPAPSDKLPVLDLIENPDKIYDPTEADLNYRTLRKMMGKSFDRHFMSVTRPIESIISPNGTIVYKKRKARPKGPKPDYIKAIGTPVRFGSSIRAPGLKVNRRTKKKFQKYIWNFTHCPVVYVWKDIGIRFWPQWIREGHCFRGRSCSIPPGMLCRPSNSTTKTILRWFCRLDNFGKIINCKWIQIQYPVITECSCSC